MTLVQEVNPVGSFPGIHSSVRVQNRVQLSWFYNQPSKSTHPPILSPALPRTLSCLLEVIAHPHTYSVVKYGTAFQLRDRTLFRNADSGYKIIYHNTNISYSSDPFYSSPTKEFLGMANTKDADHWSSDASFATTPNIFNV